MPRHWAHKSVRHDRAWVGALLLGVTAATVAPAQAPKRPTPPRPNKAAGTSDAAAVNWADVKAISVDPNPAWAYKPPQAIAGPDQVKPVQFPHAFGPGDAGPKSKAGAEPQEFLRSVHVPAPGSAVVFFESGLGGLLDSKKVRLQKVDFEAGAVAATVDLPDDVQVMDVSPDGSLALLRAEGQQAAARKRVEVYALGAAEPKRVVALTPYEGVGFFKKDVDFAAFIDNEHVLTANGEGRLVLWAVGPGKARPQYVLNLGDRAETLISRSRSVLASHPRESKEVFLIEPLTGRTVGRCRAESPITYLRVHPQGDRLAGFAEGHLLVWELETGKPATDVEVDADQLRPPLLWLGEGFVAMGPRRRVLDLRNGVVFCEYAGGDASVGFDPTFELGERIGVLFEASRLNGTPRTLWTFRLPHPTAAKAAGGLKPGDTPTVLQSKLTLSGVRDLEAPEAPIKPQPKPAEADLPF